MLEDLFADIATKRSAALTRSREVFPRNQPTASDLSACTREIALSILHWRDRPIISEDLAARFEVGKDAEVIGLTKLQRYGIPIQQQQRPFELKDRKGRVILRGHVDGLVEWQGQLIPFDYKTVNPMVYPRLQTQEAILEHRFFAKWVKQLWAYEYMADVDVGFLLLDNLLGQWHPVEVHLDFAEMERILAACEQAVEAVAAIQDEAPSAMGDAEASFLPAFHDDPEVCQKCWAFGRVCQPPRGLTGDGLGILDDPDLEALIDLHETLKPAYREYEHVDEIVKKRLRDIPQAIVGAWLITGKAGVRNEKAREARTLETWTTKILPLTPVTTQPEDVATGD